jgi:hypothetical protein
MLVFLAPCRKRSVSRSWRTQVEVLMWTVWRRCRKVSRIVCVLELVRACARGCACACLVCVCVCVSVFCMLVCSRWCVHLSVRQPVRWLECARAWKECLRHKVSFAQRWHVCDDIKVTRVRRWCLMLQSCTCLILGGNEQMVFNIALRSARMCVKVLICPRVSSDLRLEYA